MRSLSLVVPVFNEEEVLEHTVDRLIAGLSGMPLERFELILCENGSTDATRELAAALAGANPGVRLLTSDRADYGAAMKAGMLAATGEVIVNFDADYYDFDFVRRALVTHGDIVVAAKGLGDSDDRRPVLRRLASRIFRGLTRSVLGVRVHETHGMKLFRRPALDLVPLIRATKDLFDTELLARAERAGLTINELAITTQEMRPPRTGILSRVPRTVLGLFEIRRRLGGTGWTPPAHALRSRSVEAVRAAGSVPSI